MFIISDVFLSSAYISVHLSVITPAAITIFYGISSSHAKYISGLATGRNSKSLQSEVRVALQSEVRECVVYSCCDFA